MARLPLRTHSAFQRHRFKTILLAAFIVVCLLFSSLVQAFPTDRPNRELEAVDSSSQGVLRTTSHLLGSLMALFQGGESPSVPGSNLPNLDAARTTQPTEPAAPSPIVSTLACTDCTPCPTCGPGTLNHAPVVGAAGPYYGTTGSAVTFNGLRSFDLDSGDGISDYAWSFGDNTGTVHGSSPGHTYQSAGNYTVSLTVTDRHSATTTATTTAAIAAAPATVPPAGSQSGNHAQFLSQVVPTSMTAGQQYDVSVKMRNSGSTTWSAARLDRLGSLSPQDNALWGRSRIYLPRTVAPGEDVTFNFVVTAPYSGLDELPAALPHFHWQMVQDGVQWFPDGDSSDQQVSISSNYHPPYGGAPVLGPIEDLFQARIAPQNRTGRPGEDLLSGNFNWGASLLNLPGRAGMNLNLSISYNSLAAWTRTENYSGAVAYTFDADRGSPAPGFRLGFPSIQGPYSNYQAQKSAYLLLSPTGARTELRQVNETNVYESVDSSYLQLLDGGNGSMLLKKADGTQMAYWSINSEYRCTEIKDRNGNFITIKYDPINGVSNLGRITSIIDTLGRPINFNYDTNFRLQSITQLRNGQSHAWATFGYVNLSVQTNFEYPCNPEVAFARDGSCQQLVVPEQGLPEDRNIVVLTQVGLDDGSRYTFDYTTWGQVFEIHQLAADGHDLSHTSYSLPIDSHNQLNDCPRFTQRHDWVENWNDNQTADTNFEFNLAENWGEVTVAPGLTDQVSYREYSTVAYSDWTRGLVTKSETRDHTGAVKKTTTTAWERDLTGVPYAVNPRPKRMTISDSDGNRKQTSLEYTSFGLLSEVFEQGPVGINGWAILRRTHTDYNLSPAYVNRHLFGLAEGQYLFAPDAPNSISVQTLMSKTTYEYDVDTGICDGLCAGYAAAALSSSIAQHDGTNYGVSFSVGRGALSRVHDWDTNDEANSAKRLTTSIQSDLLGSVIRSRDPMSHQMTIGHTDQFSTDGTTATSPGVVTLAYATSVTDADGFSTSVKYDYDIGAVTRKQDPKGAAQTTQYDTAGRVKQVTNAVNGAYSRMIYPPSQTIGISASTVNDIDHEAFSFTVLDGAGRVRAVARDFPGTTPHYSGQYTAYDQLGRSTQIYNPVEMNADWTITGYDTPANGGFGWIFANYAYDWKGRPLVTTHADGTVQTASYGGCGCAGSEVVTLTDEGALVDGTLKHRQQIIYADVLGRVERTKVLQWEGGNVYSTTTNKYNVRDQPLEVRQYDGLDSPSGVYQETTMTYDGFGRMLTKHTPEQKLDVNNLASTDHTTWDYNTDGTIQKVTDARGVYSSLSYNNRQLVTGITYGLPGGVPTSGPSAVAPAAAVGFGYDEVGKRISMTDGLGSVSYSYNQLSRMLSETRVFNSVGTYSLSYSYNLSGELTGLTDSFNAQVGYQRDNVGKIWKVTGAGFGNVSTYASNIQYRASGQLRTLTYGNNRLLSMKYNKQLQPSHYEVSGVEALDYQYHPDGQLKFADDLVNSVFDRSYSYDNAGRLTSALSGAEARGEPATVNRPYNQGFAFDPWGNTIGRSVKNWSRTFSSGPLNITDNRVNGWQYDADGRATVTNSITSSFDAAGRVVQTSTPQRRNNPPLVLSQAFDGDGHQLKKTAYGLTTLFLRSTILGSQTVAEIYATPGQPNFGQKQVGHVYANGTELAEQNTFLNVAFYKHQEPGNGEEGTSFIHPDGTIAGGVETQKDPLGDDVGLEDPYLDAGGGGDPGFDYPRHGDLSDPHSGCTVDGQPFPCVDIGIFFSGSGIVKSVTSGLSGPMVIPRYQTIYKATPGGADVCKDGHCPNVVEVSGSPAEVVVAGYDIVETGGLSLLPVLPQNSGQVALTGKNLDRYNSERDKSRNKLQTSEKCRKFLLAHGIDPDAALDAVNQQRAYDGAASTISRLAAGVVNPEVNITSPEGSAYANGPINLSFRNNRGTKIRAWTSFYVGDAFNTTVSGRSDVYFRSSGLNSSTILHEALHSLLGIGDPALAAKLGVTVTQQDTNAISNVLHNNDCGG